VKIEKSKFRKAFTPTSTEITLFSGPFTVTLIALIAFRWPGHLVLSIAIGWTVSTLIIELVFVRSGLNDLLKRLGGVALGTICAAIYIHFRK
jgi:hypothetical protein